MLAAQPTWRALGRSAHRLAAGRAVAARAGIVATVAAGSASIVATSGGGGGAAATAALALATPVALVAPGKAAGWGAVVGFRWLGAEANKGMTAEWRVTIQATKPQAALPDKQANSSCSSLVVATLAVPVAFARAATTAAAAATAVATTTVAAAATCEERGASGIQRRTRMHAEANPPAKAFELMPKQCSSAGLLTAVAATATVATAAAARAVGLGRAAAVALGAEGEAVVAAGGAGPVAWMEGEAGSEGQGGRGCKC